MRLRGAGCGKPVTVPAGALRGKGFAFESLLPADDHEESDAGRQADSPPRRPLDPRPAMTPEASRAGGASKATAAVGRCAWLQALKAQLMRAGSREKIKAISLPLLVAQNSALFLLMRHSRSMHDDVYHATVAVLFTELIKLVLSLAMVCRDARVCVGAALANLLSRRRDFYVLAVPTVCYTIQQNLLLIGSTYLSAAACQVLTQSKTLWAATGF